MATVKATILNAVTIDADDTDPNVANLLTLQGRAQAALTANTTFLALASPTAVQVRDQTILLTKECSALIRLALNLLDSTSGT